MRQTTARGVFGLMTLVGLWLVLFVGVSTLAQEKASQPAVPSTLSETVRTKAENLSLKVQLAQTQLALLQKQAQEIQQQGQAAMQDREALLAAEEKAHPGWRVNRDTLAWEQLPPTPAPPVLPKK